MQLLIFFSYVVFSGSAALGNIYRIDLNNYTIDADRSDIEGTLSGFIIIDESLINGDSNYNRTSVAGPIDVPNWITSASITFTRTAQRKSCPRVMYSAFLNYSVGDKINCR